MTFNTIIFLQVAQKINWRLKPNEIFHQPLVSRITKKDENDLNLLKIKSPLYNTSGKYNTFFGTPGKKECQVPNTEIVGTIKFLWTICF